MTQPPHISTKPYIIGFILSVLLTIEAYFLTVSHNFSTGTIIIIVLALAVVQLLVQLFFFLHMDRIAKAPWNFVMFGLMAATVVLVVFGSLWIMKHLDYGHHHTQTEINQYLKSNEDL